MPRPALTSPGHRLSVAFEIALRNLRFHWPTAKKTSCAAHVLCSHAHRLRNRVHRLLGAQIDLVLPQLSDLFGTRSMG